MDWANFRTLHITTQGGSDVSMKRGIEIEWGKGRKKAQGGEERRKGVRQRWKTDKKQERVMVKGQI